MEPIEANDLRTLVHDHSIVLENKYAGPITVTGHIALRAPTWFKGDKKTTEKIDFGVELPLPEKGILCIDTGCGKVGRLTGMIVEGQNYRLESVPEE